MYNPKGPMGKKGSVKNGKLGGKGFKKETAPLTKTTKMDKIKSMKKGK